MHNLGRLPISADMIKLFCTTHHVRRLWLFGSIVRADFHKESDIDVMVEFDPDHIPGWEFFVMADELAALLGRPVDLATMNSLSPYIRSNVLEQAVLIYERA
jgi:hypothetical protein